MSDKNKMKLCAILTAWKRNYFEQQIESLLNQTIKPDKIFLVNNGVIDLSYLKSKYSEVLTICELGFNSKYWGRFALTYLCDSEYFIILDDDTIPGNRWIENCFRLSTEKNCIVTANGRDITNTDCYGDSGYLEKDTKVAFGGHSWFFRKEFIYYFLSESPTDLDTGEDISFSALCKIKGGIETWVPKQYNEFSAHMFNYGGDQHSSYLLTNWDDKRKNICKNFIVRGWKID